MPVQQSLLRTITDAASVALATVTESDYSSGSNTFAKQYGQCLVVVTSGPLHFGGASTVSNTGSNRGALLPAGVWTFDLSGTDSLYVIAPSGQSVTVEVLQVGV